MKRKIILSLLLCCGLAAGALLILFTTSLPLKAGIALAGHFLPGQLQVGTVQGRLSDFTLQKIEYSDGSAGTAIGEVHLRFNPFDLLSGTLSVSSLVVSKVDLHFPDSGTEDTGTENEEFMLPEITLPLAIKIDGSQIEGIRVFAKGNDSPVMINSLVLGRAAARNDLVSFALIEVAAPAFHVKSEGQIRTGSGYPVRLNVEYRLQPPGYEQIEGKVDIAGSFKRLTVHTVLEKPFSADLEGEVANLLDELQWQADFKADHASLAAIASDWPVVEFAGFTASGRGGTTGYDVRAQASTSYGGIHKVHIETEVRGNAEGLQLQNTSFRTGQGTLTGEGNMSWREDFVWQAELSGQQIDLAEISREWPGIIFSSVNLSGGGRNDTYAFKVDGNGRFGTLKSDVHASAELNGNAEDMKLQDLQLDLPEGSIKGTARLGFTDGTSWQTELFGKDINPVSLQPQLPGNIQFHITSSGKNENGAISGDIHILSLDGRVRDYPLQAGGSMLFNAEGIIARDIQLKSGQSVVRADGEYGAAGTLDFSMRSENLGELWPGLTGKLDASGNLLRGDTIPEMHVDLAGSDLSYGDIRFSSITAKIDAIPQREGNLQADIQAENGFVGSHFIQNATLDLGGTLQDHQLRADMHSGSESLAVQIEGGMDEEHWQGNLTVASINTEQYGDWRLIDRVPVSFGSGSLTVKELCLANRTGGHLCLSGDRDQGNVWRLEAKSQSLPLALLQQWSGGYANVQGTLDSTLSVTGQGSDITRAELVANTGSIKMELVQLENESTNLEWSDNNLKAVFGDKKLTVELTSTFADGSGLHGQAAVSDLDLPLSDLAAAKISGNMDVSLADLQVLAVVTYPNLDPFGQLQGQFRFAGTLLDPQVSGSASLKQGKLVVPPLGITLENVLMELSESGRRMQLELTADSGEGSIRANGTVELDPENGILQLRVDGKQFEIAHLPELSMVVSPDMDVSLSRKKGEISGTVSIDQAMIAPRNLSGSVSPSSDVVFTEDMNSENQPDKWPMYANLTVVVGDDVRINAFGLQGNLSGRLVVNDQPSKPVTGDGTLSVREGTFSVYGRELRIDSGQLLFSGGPIENPGIDVRAENKTNDVTTGIMVSGFLQEPQITFYSTPPMEENEIISRLLMNTSIIGSSEEKKGFIGSVASDTPLDPLASTVQSIKKSLLVDEVKLETGKKSEDISLVIGSWLTPDLYISYGKNLLKESGSFRTRFRIGHGFFLETESGTTQSGADLKYELER